jgi:mannose-6-phosphate isomerase-like protein (cupin superfamily)
MGFLRSIDWDNPHAELDGGYKGQILFNSEHAIVIATLVPPGARGPARHKHASDQIYLILQGEITIELGEDVQTADCGSAIYIPAGVPHHNWNAGTSDEIHLEVIAPGVLPIAPVAIPTDDTDAKGLPYYVARAGEHLVTPIEGFSVDWLVDRERGSEHATINIAEIAPGASGPPTHIHAFHQFYFVLEGTLSIEVALERHEAGPNTLVVLPAGVPHRQWNGGDVTERHFTILTPSPALPHTAETPWDIGVEFHPSETLIA